MIIRRRLLIAGGVVLLAARSPAWGQAEMKIRRVGFLMITSSNSAAGYYDAFKSGMRGLGWREGRNVEYRAAYADGQVERLDALAKELVEQKVEVILAASSPIVQAAQKATSTIPIVMTNVSNAVDSKFVASLARPGGNITGVTSQSEEVLGKLIEILHEMVPRARRIAILVNELTPPHRAYWTAAQNACAARKLVPLRVVASAPDQIAAAIAQIVREKAQAIVVVPDGMYLNERAKLEELIRATRLPAAYAICEHVPAGGLLCYSADRFRLFQYAATFVDKILKGAKPADLPVEQPTKFDLVINLKTARALGIKIPQTVLLRANEVIE
ncbi:MAG: ABC transporter substrate-binding protein [Betaproteobacteria bacterium]|nr:ABC transporter substrate-binding protein [Betaproteobacteria bacterium]